MPSRLLTNCYTPEFTTETNEPSPWTDCTFADGLMLANKASRGKYPNTRAEREALRRASGDTIGGASLQDLAKGIKNRYHWTLPVVPITLATLELRLRRKYGAASSGLYATFKGTKFARFDVHFSNQGSNSAHSMYFQGHDRKGYQHLNAAGKLQDVYVMDPLGRGTYKGEWMPWKLYVSYLMSLDHKNLYVATRGQGSV